MCACEVCTQGIEYVRTEHYGTELRLRLFDLFAFILLFIIFYWFIDFKEENRNSMEKAHQNACRTAHFRNNEVQNHASRFCSTSELQQSKIILENFFTHDRLNVNFQQFSLMNEVAPGKYKCNWKVTPMRPKIKLKSYWWNQKSWSGTDETKSIVEVARMEAKRELKSHHV